MPLLVASVGESDWNKDGTIVKVTEVIFDDGFKAPGYDLPERPEVGKPLPQGWEVAIAKSGKPYIKTPKQGKSMPTAFRNTKEGQAYEQERMDRRTALMQAVAVAVAVAKTSEVNMRATADELYTWLRQTSGVEVSGKDSSAPGNTSVPVSGATPVAMRQGQTQTSKYQGTRPAPAWPSSTPQASPAGEGSTSDGERPLSGLVTSPAAGTEPAGPAYGPTCDHPLEQQYEATSGRIKCRICKGFVD